MISDPHAPLPLLSHQPAAAAPTRARKTTATVAVPMAIVSVLLVAVDSVEFSDRFKSRRH